MSDVIFPLLLAILTFLVAWLAKMVASTMGTHLEIMRALKEEIEDLRAQVNQLRIEARQR